MDDAMNNDAMDEVRAELKHADEFYLASEDAIILGGRTLYMLRALYHLLRAQILASHPRLVDPPAASAVALPSPPSNQEYERL